MNTETCWVGNAGRPVQVLLGAEFICPACHQPLRAPALRSLPAGRAARVAGLTLGGVLLALGAGLGVEKLTVAESGAGTTIGRIATDVSQGVADRTHALLTVFRPDARPGAAPRTAKAASVPPRALEAVLGPTPVHFRVARAVPIGIPSAAQVLAPYARADRALPDAAIHPWAAPLKSANRLPRGRDWMVEVAPEAPPPSRVAEAIPDAARARPDEADTARAAPLVVSELGVVPPPKPVPGSTQAQPPETVRPPALFGRRDDTTDSVPPEAQLADLPVSAVQEAGEPESTVYAAETMHRPERAPTRLARRPALPDALRVALSAQSEHVTLPLTAAPPLPRYPALFAQEYPAGRVSAVCLLAAAGAQPDCKVLGTGTSISMTDSIGAWPKAGKVRYRAIAATARTAAAAWKPATIHS